MTPEQALTALLSRGASHVDAPALAESLLVRHGSLAPILESHVKDLMDAEGLPFSAAQLLNLIPQLTRYVQIEQSAPKGPITNWKQAGAYLRAHYIGVHYEQVYLLCLDREGRLLSAPPLVQQGTLDETPFYLRNILEFASRAGAQALVISHNHPGGTRTPSKADVQSTIHAIKPLNQMGILLLDHIIVADGEPISLFQAGPIPRYLFLEQDKQSPLLRHWLDD